MWVTMCDIGDIDVEEVQQNRSVEVRNRHSHPGAPSPISNTAPSVDYSTISGASLLPVMMISTGWTAVPPRVPSSTFDVVGLHDASRPSARKSMSASSTSKVQSTLPMPVTGGVRVDNKHGGQGAEGIRARRVSTADNMCVSVRSTSENSMLPVSASVQGATFSFGVADQRARSHAPSTSRITGDNEPVRRCRPCR